MESKEGCTLPIIDPCTGEQYLSCAAATAPDVDAACQAAFKAFSSGVWPSMSGAVSGYSRGIFEAEFKELPP